MTTLHQYISVVGCFQGCLLFCLLTFDSRVNNASRVLGVYCLLVGLYLLLPFITTPSEPNAASWLASWMFFIPACFGPLHYLYSKKAILDKPLIMNDLIHLAPYAFCCLLNLDVLLFDNEALRAWVHGQSAPTLRLWLSEYILFVVAFIYFSMTIIVLWRYQRAASNSLSSFDPAKFRWLQVLVLTMLIVWLAKGILAFTSIAMLHIFVISDATIVIYIYLVALAQWRNPKLFTIEQLANIQVSSSNVVIKPELKSRGALDVDTRAELFESVRKIVEERALYRDSELTLTSLAGATGVAVHHLSEVLNQHSGKNFNHFINFYRVVDVQKRLKEDVSGNILDIAMEAGFSSKSTFNTMFKKITGQTPSEYRKQL